MNTERGEMTVEINGREILLRPAFNELAAIRSKVGCGEYALLRRFESGDWGVTEVGAVIWAGRNGAGDKIDYLQCMDEVMRHGPAALFIHARLFLANALMGGKAPAEDDQKKATKSRKTTR